MDLYTNNKKVENLVKEAELRVSKIILNNTNIFGHLNNELDINVLKSLISNISKQYIKKLIYNCKQNNDNCRGILGIPNNSIFSTIDYAIVTDYDSKIPVIPDEVINNIVKILMNTISLYKDTLLPELKMYKANVSSLIDKIDTVDYSAVFNYVGLDWNYFFDIAVEQNYLIKPPQEFNKELNTLVNPDAFPATIDEAKAMLAIDTSASINAALEDYLDTIPNLDDILKEYISSIKGDYLSTMNALTLNRSMARLPFILISYIITKNILKTKNDILSTNDKDLLAGILGRIYGDADFYLRKLKQYIDNKDPIIISYSKDGQYDYTITYIKPNLDNIANDGVNLFTLAGVIIKQTSDNDILSATNQPYHVTKDKILSNITLYNNTYESYLEFLSASDRNKDITALINIYSLAASKINPYIVNNYSTLKNISNVGDAIIDYVSNLSVAELMNIDTTSKNIFVNIVANKTLFGTFIEEMDNAVNVLGKSTTPEKAAFYATIVLLVQFLTKQIKVV